MAVDIVVSDVSSLAMDIPSLYYFRVFFSRYSEDLKTRVTPTQLYCDLSEHPGNINVTLSRRHHLIYDVKFMCERNKIQVT